MTEADDAAIAAQRAVENARAAPNNVRHIFDQAKHNWDMTGLDQQGNWNLIQITLQNNYVKLSCQGKGPYKVEQNFGNYTVTVGGAIVNGVVYIGSAWVNAS